MRHTAAFIVGLALAAACAQKIDQQKFEPLYRAGKAMEGSVGVGVSLLKHHELIQELATEIAVARPKAQSDVEKQLVDLYDKALTAFKDADTLWRKKIGQGATMRAAADPEVAKIVETYPITGNGTGPAFTFSPDDAIRTIWQRGGALLASADNLYQGKDPSDLPTPR